MGGKMDTVVEVCGGCQLPREPSASEAVRCIVGQCGQDSVSIVLLVKEVLRGKLMVL